MVVVPLRHHRHQQNYMQLHADYAFSKYEALWNMTIGMQ